jgi:uncharacterized PurR-regulated membrane protein YhhQ (DUF165 family)
MPVEKSRREKRLGWAFAFGFAGSVYLANWLLVHVGFVNVGFGLTAPAGVLAAGLALVLRDLVQLNLGRSVAIGAVLVGAAISLTISPTFAVASALAFLVSELCDMGVYTPLRRRGLGVAVLASGIVGLFVDSIFFLLVAFGSLEFLWGQVLGKLYVTVAAWLVLEALHRKGLVAAEAVA